MTFEENVIAAVDRAVEDGAPMPAYVYEAYKALIESRQPVKCVCSRTERGYCAALNCHGGADVQEWIETTMTNCLINDRIRIGREETTVLRSNHGIWHANNTQWQPARWDHVELRMELEAVPGFKQYPAAASIELLCTPERLAVLRMQEGFPGSAVTSSHVD